jgi:hypothetical protein
MLYLTKKRRFSLITRLDNLTNEIGVMFSRIFRLFRLAKNRNKMSAFSASTYASEAYKAFRPTYSSSSLLALLKGYHKGALGCAVDIGCGTGQVRWLLTR